jgi:hypothetical protein
VPSPWAGPSPAPSAPPWPWPARSGQVPPPDSEHVGQTLSAERTGRNSLLARPKLPPITSRSLIRWPNGHSAQLRLQLRLRSPARPVSPPRRGTADRRSHRLPARRAREQSHGAARGRRLCTNQCAVKHGNALYGRRQRLEKMLGAPGPVETWPQNSNLRTARLFEKRSQGAGRCTFSPLATR